LCCCKNKLAQKERHLTRFKHEVERPATCSLFVSGCDHKEMAVLGEAVNVPLLVSTAKTHRVGENHQMAEDAEELGQIQEQREGDFIYSPLQCTHSAGVDELSYILLLLFI